MFSLNENEQDAPVGRTCARPGSRCSPREDPRTAGRTNPSRSRRGRSPSAPFAVRRERSSRRRTGRAAPASAATRSRTGGLWKLTVCGRDACGRQTAPPTGRPQPLESRGRVRPGTAGRPPTPAPFHSSHRPDDGDIYSLRRSPEKPCESPRAIERFCDTVELLVTDGADGTLHPRHAGHPAGSPPPLRARAGHLRGVARWRWSGSRFVPRHSEIVRPILTKHSAVRSSHQAGALDWISDGVFGFWELCSRHSRFNIKLLFVTSGRKGVLD
jgi:hypothetical protein